MGLKERRVAAEFKDGKFVSVKAEIDATAGFEVAMNIDWDSLPDEGYDPESWEDNFMTVYFSPILRAFKNICTDDMGKEALKAAFKSIDITNKDDRSNPIKFTFDDGVLKIDHKSCSNCFSPTNEEERTNKIIKLMESAL